MACREMESSLAFAHSGDGRRWAGHGGLLVGGAHAFARVDVVGTTDAEYAHRGHARRDGGALPGAALARPRWDGPGLPGARRRARALGGAEDRRGGAQRRALDRAVPPPGPP